MKGGLKEKDFRLFSVFAEDATEDNTEIAMQNISFRH